MWLLKTCNFNSLYIGVSCLLPCETYANSSWFFMFIINGLETSLLLGKILPLLKRSSWQGLCFKGGLVYDEKPYIKQMTIMFRLIPVSPRKIAFLALLGCLTALPAGATEIKDAVDKAGFIPHKALYDLKLAGTKSGSQVVNITGQMYYEWYPTCDGWISNHRFNISYEYADSPGMSIASDFSTFESFDGKKLDFTSQRKKDGEIVSEVRGHADDVVAGSTTGLATFKIPDGLKYDLPAGTLFPMAHSLSVVDALREGKKIYTATVFDGSDEDGPVEINAVIGKDVQSAPQDNNNIDQNLMESPARNVRLAFFPLKDQSSSSDYEMSLVFHDNSVISDMLIDYDDFSVHQKLVALEKIEGTCQK